MKDELGIAPGGRYHVSTEEDLLAMLLLHVWPYETASGDAPGARRQAEQALARWLQRGLPHRVVDGCRRFDCWQVLNFIKWTARRHDDPTYWDNQLPSMRRSVTAWAGGPQRFAVRLRRTFHLPGGPSRSPLRLRLPLPYEDHTQRNLQLEEVRLHGADAQAECTPGRLEFRLAPPTQPTLVVAEACYRLECARTQVTVEPARLEPYDCNDPDWQLYTRPVEGWVRVTPFVTELAESLAGQAPQAWAAVLAFWDYFLKHLHAGYIHHDELDAGDPLQALVRGRWFDCVLGSSLFVALCRARGIPARVIEGWSLRPLTPSQHFWVEVLLPPFGWVPLDLAGWNLGGQVPSAWDHYFVGQLDYRMKVACLPRWTAGLPGVPFPLDWYALGRLAEGGVDADYWALGARRLLYQDHVRVERVPASDSPCYEPAA